MLLKLQQIGVNCPLGSCPKQQSRKILSGMLLCWDRLGTATLETEHLQETTQTSPGLPAPPEDMIAPVSSMIACHLSKHMCQLLLNFAIGFHGKSKITNTVSTTLWEATRHEVSDSVECCLRLSLQDLSGLS